MLFSSITFLYVFLPAVLLLYFIAPARLKNPVLLLSSLVFYFFGEPIYTVLLLVSSLSDYLHSLYIEKHRGEKSAKAALVSSVAVNLGMLGFFKYSDFFIENFNAVSGSHLALLHIALPLGISFFTFQTMSYTIDVYRGKVHAEKNLATLMTYVCLFPQLVAGPIVRYETVAHELHERAHTLDNIASGIRRFLFGLSKKVLLANNLGELCSLFQASDEKSVLFYWIYAISFALQIYFDFSGYSDMAIGLGKIFGFHFPENFQYPYISRSITEFWRRWHMSLSSWFRDYVYIPLGGNRVTRGKWIRNILVVWMLTGFWHGAEWNFVCWGLLFGVLLLLEKMVWGAALSRLPAVFQHVYTLFLVVISFVVFNADGMAGVFQDLAGMFGGLSLPLYTRETLYYLQSYAVLLVLAAVGATPLVKNAAEKAGAVKSLRPVIAILEPVGLTVLLLTCSAYLIDGSFNPFLYFRF